MFKDDFSIKKNESDPLQWERDKDRSDFDPLTHYPDHDCKPFISDPSEAVKGIHPFPNKLWVVTCLENPLRWRSRYANYEHFARHVRDAGAILITVESAFGDRHFEITDPKNPYHVQVRCQDELFRKENLHNIGAQKLPLGTQYVAFIDADVTFARPDWAQETLHLLQHYLVIQMFSSFVDVGPNHEIIRSMPSFMWNYFNEPDGPCKPEHSGYGFWHGKKWSGAPGLAWAYRVEEALDELGGLLDRCILGGGDSHMAYGIMQQTDLAKLHLEMLGATHAYRRYLATWQANAARLKKNAFYMEGSLLHKWHGHKANRGYNSRWKILEKSKFDPYVDVMEDHQRVLRLSGNKPELRDELRAYFRSRLEDSIETTLKL